MREEYLYFGARLHLLLLGDGVGHHHGLERGAVDARDGRTGEDAVCEDGVDLRCAGIDQPGGGNGWKCLVNNRIIILSFCVQYARNRRIQSL